MNGLTISGRLYLLVGSLGLALAAILGISFYAFHNNEMATESVAATGRQSVLASRMNTNIQAMRVARAQLSVPGATAQEKQTAQSQLEAEKKLFTERLEALQAVGDPQQRGALDEIGRSFAVYRTALDGIIEAGRVDDVALMRRAVEAADKAASGLREQTREMLARASDKADAAVASARSENQRYRLFLMGFTGAVLLGAFAMVYLIGTLAIVRPLRGAVSTLGSLASGNLNVEPAGGERRDEIGEMARGLKVFREGLVERRRLEQEKAAEQAAREERAAKLERLIENFSTDIAKMVGALAQEASTLGTTAVSLSRSADDGSRLATTVSAGAHETATNVETVAAATQELSSSIDEITRRVEESTRIVDSARDRSHEADVVILELAESSQKIGDVITLINAIASQTNLLALNATIEAARAGDSGKGFAVVASEVKHLANQTAKATEEISNHVLSVQSNTQRAVGAIRDVTLVLDQMSEVSASIAAAVEEQAAATGEIARNVEEAARGTTMVTESINGVCEAAQMTGTSAGAVAEAAGSVDSNTGRLRGAVNDFIYKIENL